MTRCGRFRYQMGIWVIVTDDGQDLKVGMLAFGQPLEGLIENRLLMPSRNQ
jgi:hypothetical protein